LRFPGNAAAALLADSFGVGNRNHERLLTSRSRTPSRSCAIQTRGFQELTSPIPSVAKKPASKSKKKTQPSKKAKKSVSKQKTSGDHRILMSVGKSLSTLGTKIAAHLKK
jgi:hypothetical protein